MLPAVEMHERFIKFGGSCEEKENTDSPGSGENII